MELARQPLGVTLPSPHTARCAISHCSSNFFDSAHWGIAAEVADVTRTWAQRATTGGIPTHELDGMRSSFEHEDLDIATGR